MTSQDLLKDAVLLGYYAQSFMQICVNFKFKKKLFRNSKVTIDNLVDSLDDKDCGTLLHEYIHFLQNTSTPFGLWSSMVEYNIMGKDFAYYQEQGKKSLADSTLRSHDEKEKKSLLRRNLGNLNYNYMNFPSIKAGSTIRSFSRVEILEGEKREIAFLLYDTEYGKPLEVPLGAWIIQECMAVMFEDFINPGLQHPDVPYNILTRYIEQNYPDIYRDKAKVIALLYMSLFDLNPGVEFLKQINIANNNKSMTATQLFEYYVDNHTIRKSDGNLLSIREFMKDIIDHFKKILQLLLGYVELDYIACTLDRVDMSSGFVPLLTIVSDGRFDRDRMKKLMSYLGIPFIFSTQGGAHYPTSVKNTSRTSQDIVRLTEASALYAMKRHNQCLLMFACRRGRKLLKKGEGCTKQPWKGCCCRATKTQNIIFLPWYVKLILKLEFSLLPKRKQ